jgi:UDP-N-acetylglucosamine acyltransferase
MTQKLILKRSPRIHETAMVHPKAKIGYNVIIGPYSFIGENVELGDDCEIGSNVSIDGWTIIGQGNRFYSGAAIGYAPQDYGYKGEQTYLYIGNNNTFLERVTIHRGTTNDHLETRIGNNNLFMPNSHVAHDCLVGDGNYLGVSSALAGHVIIEDYVTVGDLSGIHQFCQIGKMVKIGATTKIIKDVPPFIVIDGNPAVITGVNLDELNKYGLSKETCDEIVSAYKLLFHSKMGVERAIEEMEQKLKPNLEIDHFIHFIQNSGRGFHRRY